MLLFTRGSTSLDQTTEQNKDSVGRTQFPLLVKTIFLYEVLSDLDLGLGYYMMSFMLEVRAVVGGNVPIFFFSMKLQLY